MIGTNTKTISDYTIYCTEDQTKKALELGAPLIQYNCYIHRHVNPCAIGKECYITPTSEQMMGWLEDQGQSIEVSRLYRNNQKWSAFVDDTQIVGKYYPTRKEAILDAIDAALEYLENKQQ